jgi:hypothetical protein
MKRDGVSAAVISMAAAVLAHPASAVTLTFVGVITSGADNGAVFSPVGTSLVGDPIVLSFSHPTVDAGTTETDDFVTATVKIRGVSYGADDNDIPTPIAYFLGPPDTVVAQAEQNFDLGYSEVLVRIVGGGAIPPPGADLNTPYIYHVKPGDTVTGGFSLVNEGFPDSGYEGPPFGGPGSSTPWSDHFGFTISTLYANVPGPAPEPTAWALMLLGLGIVGAAARARPQRSALTA